MFRLRSIAADIRMRGYIVVSRYISSSGRYCLDISDGHFFKSYFLGEEELATENSRGTFVNRTVKDFENYLAFKRIENSPTGLSGSLTTGYYYSPNGSIRERKDYMRTPEIKNVIFNDPATIVFWSDGTKTVVKAQNEDFDPEKGIAMAIAKKFFGNKGNYFNRIKKWVEPYEACKYWEGIFAMDLSGIKSCSYNIGDVIKKSAAKVASIECVIKDMFGNEKKGSE